VENLSIDPLHGDLNARLMVVGQDWGDNSRPSLFPRSLWRATIGESSLEYYLMSYVVDATYENGVLKLEQPLPLKEREKVRVTVESVAQGRHSVLDIRSISLGEVRCPLTTDDDILGEMLEGRG
jgi:predicted DNA-binding antitoxin AbrB/MazE fold protein